MSSFQFMMVEIAIAVAAGIYLVWVGYRIYMALGKCPQCSHRINRAVTVCGACGCRVHEHSSRNSTRNLHRRAA